jgi:hypothetical protein
LKIKIKGVFKMNPRLDGLFQYLNLLCGVNSVHGSNNFSVQKAIVRTCKEIEKELIIPNESNEIDGTVNVTINHLCKEYGWTPSQIAEMISKAISEKAKMTARI